MSYLFRLRYSLFISFHIKIFNCGIMQTRSLILTQEIKILQIICFQETVYFVRIIHYLFCFI